MDFVKLGYEFNDNIVIEGAVVVSGSQKVIQNLYSILIMRLVSNLSLVVCDQPHSVQSAVQLSAGDLRQTTVT